MTEKYPASWWQDPTENSNDKLNALQGPKYDWEIFPSEAGPGSVVLSKRTELGLLSNLAPTPFTMNGSQYASIEALWQMTKLPDPEMPKDPRQNIEWPSDRHKIKALSGLDSKRIGDAASALMKENHWSWVSYLGEKMQYPEEGKGPFYQLIRSAMEAKVSQNKKVFDILLATKGLILRPDHQQIGALSPAHLYHQIWMDIRDQIEI